MTINSSLENDKLVRSLNSCFDFHAVKVRSFLDSPSQVEDQFDLHGFLSTLASLTDEFEGRDVKVLDSLARKIEVFRCLYRTYDKELRKSLTPELIDPDLLNFLCAVYMRLFVQSGDFRYLNTSLKMLDGIIERPTYIPADDLGEIAQSLIWWSEDGE